MTTQQRVLALMTNTTVCPGANTTVCPGANVLLSHALKQTSSNLGKCIFDFNTSPFLPNTSIPQTLQHVVFASNRSQNRGCRGSLQLS